jgi:hypothetical protein
MAPRKPKAKPQRRIKRGRARRPSRPNARAKAKPKKPSRKVPVKRGKAGLRRKAAPRVKSPPIRSSTAKKRVAARVRRTPASDPRLEIAVKELNRGSSLTAAAHSVNLTPKALQSYVRQRRLARRKGDRWTIKDNRPRRVPVMTKGRSRNLTVAGFKEAQLVGEHHNAVGNFVRTNDIALLKPFESRSVRLTTGKEIPLETDPNALHRIAAMDTPPFHEIYKITSNT